MSPVIFSSFAVGIVVSLGTSFAVLERLRDRKLMCEAKYDENVLAKYKYNEVCCCLFDITVLNLLYISRNYRD
jgi:hypothetical protein